MRNAGLVLSSAIALGLLPSIATACDPTFNETWRNAGSVTWTGDTGDCTLETRASPSTPVIATAHYRRAQPEAPLRLSFTIDAPPVSWPTLSVATIARGTAHRASPTTPGQASMFQLQLFGASGSLRMYATAACPTSPNGLCTGAYRTVTFPVDVTLEFQTGEGAAGRLSYWIGSDTSGPPTATIENLDNAAWGGVERVTLGLADLNHLFRSTIGDQPLSFSSISTSEPQLFWNDFDRGAGQAVAPTRPAIMMAPHIVQGDTCDATAQLPVIASGSTALSGHVDVYPLVVGDHLSIMPSVVVTSTRPSTVVFICEDEVSTTSRCVAAGSSEHAHWAAVSRPGRYHIVVGQTVPPCGPYALQIGPMALGTG